MNSENKNKTNFSNMKDYMVCVTNFAGADIQDYDFSKEEDKEILKTRCSADTIKEVDAA